MKVKDVMKKDLITVHQDMTCYEAASLLLKHKITGAPVVDDQGKLVGVFSEKDIFRALFPNYQSFYENPELFLNPEESEKEVKSNILERKVSEVMKKNFVVANPETPILKVAAQMITTGFHRVPVLENGKLVGIVTRHEIYRAILEKYLNLS